jgi:hypothetical protein
VRSGMANLAREIRKKDGLASGVKLKAIFRLKRSARKLAAAHENAAKQAVRHAKVRAEVNQMIAEAGTKQRSSRSRKSSSFSI